MTSTLRAHHLVHQRFDSSVQFRGSCQWGKIHSASDKEQKVDFKLGGIGSVWPTGVVQAHCRGGMIGTKSLFREGKIDHAGDSKWTSLNSSQNFAFSNYSEPGFICDAELSATKTDDSLQASVATANPGTAADFDRLNRTSDSSCYRIPQKPFAPLGWLSLGLCGNALIMRIGSDARCFHHQGLSRGLVDLGELASCGSSLYMPADAKAFGWSRSRVGGSISEVKVQQGVSLLQGKSIVTRSNSRDERGRERQNKQKKSGKTATLTRDLYERSSFHLFEILFCYPFLNTKAVASNLQIPSRKNLKEVGSILNQAAVGLAGVSATWVLFVASRILWLDVSLNKHSITSLAIGFGFLSLSWAMKRVSDVFLRLVGAYSKSRALQQDYITSLQNELQCIALNAILLVVMCLMGGG